MAKIKKSSKINVVSVFEDINPANNTIYLEGEGYNKSTLAPLFDAAMYMQSALPTTSYLGDNVAYLTGGDYAITASGKGPGTMALGKETAYTQQNVTTRSDNSITSNSYFHLLSMDETVRATGIQKIESNDNNVLYVWNNVWMNGNGWRMISWLNPVGELYNISPSTNFNNGDNYNPIMPTQEEVGTKWISIICNYQYGNQAGSAYAALGRNYMFDFSDNNDTHSTTARSPYNIQYIGNSPSTGKPLYLYNSHSTDYQQYITRHNVSANTTTDLYTFSTVPTAAGTNYGGARATTTIGTHTKWASKTFADPTSAGNVGFYVPYFDSQLNYHPFWFQWNKSTDVFTRNSDITITGDLSSVYFNSHLGSSGNGNQMSAHFYNETFVSGGNRYLSLFPIHNSYQVHDSTPLARTVVTYQVDPTNPKALTHHSAVTIPATPRAMVFLNDDRTMFGVICESAIYIYNWNNTDGWVLTTTYAGKFTSLGRDSTDRIWATEVSGHTSYASIHLITPTVPVRITITPAASSYNYTGTDINSTVGISAYNLSNERIAVSVALSIEGSTMNFGSGATTATVTTSTSADVSQAIVITGSGLSDIVASVQV